MRERALQFEDEQGGSMLECLRKGTEASMLQKGMRDKRHEVREATESALQGAVSQCEDLSFDSE